MKSRVRNTIAYVAALLAAPVSLCGCTTIQEYIHNGFKVGPNYRPPPAPVAKHWLDAADERVSEEPADLSGWWKVFQDPVLDDLICRAYRQNLTLREASFRVLQARAQLAITQGELFPQSQTATGDYKRVAFSTENANTQIPTPAGPIPLRQFFSQWDFGFNLSWELDFWGRIRRAIEANADELGASVADYDDVLVTLLGDVATNYVQLRTAQQRIEYARKNVELQKETVAAIEAGVKAGAREELDLRQARTILDQTEAQIPELEIGLRQASNRLCILLGMPPAALREMTEPAKIPSAPDEAAVVGIPADLLRRRPDVRRAERLAAARCAAIGVAEADLYPRFAIDGSIGYSAEEFSHLFRSTALDGEVGPSFQWNILNYGRIRNNVRLQDARFQELATAYQEAVLNAQREVEDGMATFLRARERAKSQAESVDEALKAVGLIRVKQQGGTVDVTRVTLIEQNLVQQQDTLAQARGEIALGLIQVYRALGGGWQIRCTGCETTTPPDAPPPDVTLPPPPDAAPADEP